MDVEKTKIKVPASSVPGEGPPPGLHGPLLPVFLHGGESALGSILHLIRALIPLRQPHLLDLIQNELSSKGPISIYHYITGGNIASKCKS